MIKLTDEDLAKMTAFQNKYLGKKKHLIYPYKRPILYQAQRYALGDDYMRVLITGTNAYSDNYYSYNDEKAQNAILFAIRHKVNFNMLNHMAHDFKYILVDDTANAYGVDSVTREQCKEYHVVKAADVLNVCQLIKGLNVRHSMLTINLGYCGKHKPVLINARYEDDFELNALIGVWEID